MTPTISDLHRPVAVSWPGLVSDNLHPVKLDDGAGRASTRGRVEDGRHALFDRDHACAMRGRDGLAREGRGRGRAEDGQMGGSIEAVGLRWDGLDRVCGADGTDGAIGKEGKEEAGGEVSSGRACGRHDGGGRE